MRIYRHALESIFSMLQLGDLSRALAVSRSWSAAVRSMKAIRGEIQSDVCFPDSGHPLPPIDRLVVSPLLRHLTAIEIAHADIWTMLDTASLGLLAQHASSLTSLGCKLTLTPGEPLVLPAKLETLELQLDANYTDAVINGVMTTVAALPSLSLLCLGLADFLHATAVDLTLLEACPSLTTLGLVTSKADSGKGEAPNLSTTQLEQIRSSLGHLRLFYVGGWYWKQHGMLKRLLKRPVTVRWQDIGRVFADETTGKLLRRLPTLTRLDLRYTEETMDVDFLMRLPQLAVLALDCFKTVGWFIPSDVLFQSLAVCTGITDLSLTCGFDHAYWSALFEELTQLKKLSIGRAGLMETLECFASGPWYLRASAVRGCPSLCASPSPHASSRQLLHFTPECCDDQTSLSSHFPSASADVLLLSWAWSQ